jgi:predicted dithiol-disulfide oxidoreductase (DUF899 family)
VSLPEIVSSEDWVRARVRLLEREKALTKARDELAAERRRLPMVEVTEVYRFIAADGGARTLFDLFEGRHQLIVDLLVANSGAALAPGPVAFASAGLERLRRAKRSSAVGRC